MRVALMKSVLIVEGDVKVRWLLAISKPGNKIARLPQGFYEFNTQKELAETLWASESEFCNWFPAVKVRETSDRPRVEFVRNLARIFGFAPPSDDDAEWSEWWANRWPSFVPSEDSKKNDELRLIARADDFKAQYLEALKNGNIKFQEPIRKKSMLKRQGAGRAISRKSPRAIATLPPGLPIPPEQAIREITEFCKALRRTVNRSDGGFLGAGNGSTISDSGEWTTAMNVYVLSAWDLKEYKSVVGGAIDWLLGEQRRHNGGWIDGGFDFPGDQSPACTEATTWGILALLKAADELDEGLRARAYAAVGDATNWLLVNQQNDGGWGSCEKAATSESRTYATAMSLIALLDLKNSSHPAWTEETDNSLNLGISFLDRTKQSLGWGFVPNKAVQLPATAVALSALLMASDEGYTPNNTTLDTIGEEWMQNMANETFELTECTDMIKFNNPIDKSKVSSVNVPFAWHEWTLVASTLLDDRRTIRLAHDYIAERIFPKRDEKFPWLSAMAAYGLMLYLRRNFPQWYRASR
jgi:hypothetical protein